MVFWNRAFIDVRPRTFKIDDYVIGACVWTIKTIEVKSTKKVFMLSILDKKKLWHPGIVNLACFYGTLSYLKQQRYLFYFEWFITKMVMKNEYKNWKSSIFENFYIKSLYSVTFIVYGEDCSIKS